MKLKKKGRENLSLVSTMNKPSTAIHHETHSLTWLGGLFIDSDWRNGA